MYKRQGFHSGLNADSSSAGSVFNVYTAGTASNYLRAGISGGGTDHNSSTWSININGTASGITVTRAAVVTDEQAGTVETLLDIITDLRARVAALEAAGQSGY